jgi:hypothetical protein
VVPCGNSSPALLGKFVCFFFPNPEKNQSKIGKMRKRNFKTDESIDYDLDTVTGTEQ